jgi:hypothetical protein
MNRGRLDATGPAQRHGPNFIVERLQVEILRSCGSSCNLLGSFAAFDSDDRFSLRKEVIQPQVLLRLPCYDFTPIMSHTLGLCEDF